ncbi:MAG: iron-sulfur cluster assembly accessory protein [Cyclobacteriaceae bacterium]|nr:iron-sulfur cluster assembly accessory protein [Cyclobacteriaceae bacterium]
MAIKINPVRISERAAQEALKIFETKNIPDNYGLRIGVKASGGCGGKDFYLGFDLQKEDDDAFMLSNLKLLINKKETMYLMGLEVDYHEGTHEQGFFFKTPE